MTETAKRSTSNQSARYPVLDALRFVLALWVVMSHFGVFPLFAGADTSNRLTWAATHLWSTATFGVTAVIGFFVISGFCIHLPFRNDEKLDIGRYYARRYTRILIPVCGFLAVNRLAGNHQPVFGQESVLWNSVLWSLLCEEIYYAIYPMIRPLRKRFGWAPILSITFPLSVVTTFLKHGATGWYEVGAFNTAVVLFPVWLLGCLLAEQSDRLIQIDSSFVIWKWRFLAWAGSWACEMLHFHGGIPYTYTMLWFGVLAYVWIKKEIAYGLHKSPSTLLASGGVWSYSLYLMHYPAMDIFNKLRIPNLGYSLSWCVSYAFILAFSYGFYFAVERPSHRLARRFKAIGDRQPAPASDAESVGSSAPSQEFQHPGKAA